VTFNAQLIGKHYAEVKLSVTPETVDSFVRAIGESNPIFLDPVAAQAAGYDQQLAPPTILARIQIVAVLEITADPEIGVEFDGIVHGEQNYVWTRPVEVGDELSTIPLITDIRSRGSVSFLDVELDVRDASGATVVVSRSTMVHLDGGVSR
jgi:acyl dehydratase